MGNDERKREREREARKNSPENRSYTGDIKKKEKREETGSTCKQESHAKIKTASWRSSAGIAHTRRKREFGRREGREKGRGDAILKIDDCRQRERESDGAKKRPANPSSCEGGARR